MKNNYIIAIDGPAASGKSTTAKKLAEILEYIYLDTGAMYRACALAAELKNVEISDNPDLKEMTDNINLEISYSASGNKIYLDGENVSDRIREEKISGLASKIAKLGFVREKMVSIQREIGKKGRVILDGRDIGTVVFPDADFKFFMLADTEIRAKRRWEELQQKGFDISLEEVREDIVKRDKNDSDRQNAPLKKADDAIEIDTSELTVEEQIKTLLKFIKKESKIGDERV